MDAPFNTVLSDGENEEDAKVQKFEFEEDMTDSPRLIARAALKVSKEPHFIADSIPTFAEMKSLNSNGRFDRITRPRIFLERAMNSGMEMDK